VAHIVVFFILIVSNCGGLLTPLGDPPLFLGFLNGVPFGWTLSLWKQWLLINGGLLVVFHVWDEVVLDKEERERPGSQLEAVMTHAPLRVHGKLNLLFLLGVVASVYASGRGLGFGGEQWPLGLREGVMLVLTAAAYVLTPSQRRHDNGFAFGPIIEVAVLFAGIFVTMTPALLLLNTHGPKLGLREPWHYFWATGILSSVLDNAPTYLTFAAAACGQAGVPLAPGYLGEFLSLPAGPEILAAISCGAVFMGANTYIGNGPNFMVKAIAEAGGVRMPGFFGYMVYSTLVAVPLFVAATWLFFVH
jgi:Na+/H+ antiporter NhaD/arsenite permease-like protein